MTDPIPLVVKVGGGLLRTEGLKGLSRACAEAAQMCDIRVRSEGAQMCESRARSKAARTCGHRPVLVVPGGGPFADAVRVVDAQVGLADGVAHDLALRAMDQLGALLLPLLPDAQLLTRLTAPGSLGLLAAAPAFGNRPDIPRSWKVTSDSLAVLAAAAIGANEAILLKPVAGVLARWPSDDPPLATLTADELEALQSRGGGRAVDPYLPEAVRRTGVAVVVRRPGPASPGGTRIIQNPD